jgi:hypothetical protein
LGHGAAGSTPTAATPTPTPTPTPTTTTTIITTTIPADELHGGYRKEEPGAWPRPLGATALGVGRALHLEARAQQVHDQLRDVEAEPGALVEAALRGARLC